MGKRVSLERDMIQRQPFTNNSVKKENFLWENNVMRQLTFFGLLHRS